MNHVHVVHDVRTTVGNWEKKNELRARTQVSAPVRPHHAAVQLPRFVSHSIQCFGEHVRGPLLVDKDHTGHFEICGLDERLELFLFVTLLNHADTLVDVLVPAQRITDLGCAFR